MGTPNVAADRVLVTSSTTGTGTYALGSAVAGHFAPADITPSLNGARVPFTVVDSLTAPTVVEIGEGVLTSGAPWTLSRATIRRTLNAGVVGSSAINWPSGTRYLLIGAPNAANIPMLETDGSVILAAGAEIRAQNTAKAWALFNGSALVDSYGIASITDHGVGDVTFTFTTAFANANYVILGTASLLNSDGAITTFQPRSDTSQISLASCRMLCSSDVNASGRTLTDAAYMCAAFFGDP